MPALKTSLFLFSATFLTLLCAPEAKAIRPMSNSIALVAGEGTGGFRDGDFTSAFFKKPLGLALSPDGTRLFVADSANNRIREIHLDQNNKVTTLVGQENPGSQNGSLASASFKQPQGVVALPEERLVVNDFGNKFLRLVDMKSKTVSTLTGTAFEPVTASIPSTSLESEAESTGTQVSMARIRDMVYLPTADSLFFSQPDQGTLKRLDLKTGQVTLVLHNRTELPHPAALCGSTNMPTGTLTKFFSLTGKMGQNLLWCQPEKPFPKYWP